MHQRVGYLFTACLAILIAGSVILPQTRISQAQTTTTPVPASNFKIDLETVGKGFNTPVYMTNAGDGSNRLFVVEKAGRIMLLKDGQPSDQPFLDITPLVLSSDTERGLLGVAFHPKYKTNGLFYVYYTGQGGEVTIARYQVSSSNPDVADPNSAKILLTIPHALFSNHNGGSILFGPDGYLYFGVGDGGSAGDPNMNGQNTRVLLAKILRIDVDSGDPYGIPKDNPFADGKNGRPEIWAYGLRNPWRFSFDPATGDMIIGDVGQNLYEEVDVQKAGTPGGVNYGWNVMEGFHCYDADTCDQSGKTLPVVEYTHDLGCAITGGYVYRGQKYPQLQGTYFYGDFCSGRIWAMQPSGQDQWKSTQVYQASIAISSFGRDEQGELYVLDLNSGTIYHLVDNS